MNQSVKQCLEEFWRTKDAKHPLGFSVLLMAIVGAVRNLDGEPMGTRTTNSFLLEV